MDHMWWGDYDNIVLVAHYMADNGRLADEVAYMVEKPWKFVDEYKAAKGEPDAI